jgi:dolichol kinase
MTNIIKSGAGGLAAGIVGGIIAVAFLPFTVSVFAVATFGGAIGLTAGLVEGAAMESFGINDRIENIKVDTHDYVFNCSCGQPRGHH